MLTPELVDFLAGPVSIGVASGDASARPVYTRVFGIAGEAGTDRATVYAAEATAGPLLACIQHRPLIAVLVGDCANFQSVQFKGEVVDVRPADPEGDAVVDHITAKVLAVAGPMFGGPFAEGWARFVLRPALAITLVVREIYRQTPGPDAGARVA